MVQEWTDSELLHRIRNEDKELWSALRELAELYKTNPDQAKSVINQLISWLKK